MLTHPLTGALILSSCVCVAAAAAFRQGVFVDFLLRFSSLVVRQMFSSAEQQMRCGVPKNTNYKPRLKLKIYMTARKS